MFFFLVFQETMFSPHFIGCEELNYFRIKGLKWLENVKLQYLYQNLLLVFLKYLFCNYFT